jgi:hypothetical protein
MNTAIENLIAGGTVSDFQTAVATYTPAEVIAAAGALLRAATIDQAGFRTVMAALVS